MNMIEMSFKFCTSSLQLGPAARECSPLGYDWFRNAAAPRANSETVEDSLEVNSLELCQLYSVRNAWNISCHKACVHLPLRALELILQLCFTKQEGQTRLVPLLRLFCSALDPRQIKKGKNKNYQMRNNEQTHYVAVTKKDVIRHPCCCRLGHGCVLLLQ